MASRLRLRAHLAFATAVLGTLSSAWAGKPPELWPQQLGPLYNEADPDGYVHELLQRDSIRISGWAGQNGGVSLETLSACGVVFDVYLRHRPDANYALVVISTNDQKDHELSWLPVEYRFNNNATRPFLRSDGSKPREKGASTASWRFKTLEALRFSDSKQFSSNEWLQIYLPWVENCDQKPVARFKREKDRPMADGWDYPMNSWVTIGAQAILPSGQGGWAVVKPSPSYFLRATYFGWNRHGITGEAHVSPIKGVLADNDILVGFLARISYGYAFQLGRYVRLSPEAGYRALIGTQDFHVPAFGAGINLAWEVPRTRHRKTGARLVIDLGLHYDLFFGNVTVNNQNLNGGWPSAKLGLGIGW